MKINIQTPDLKAKEALTEFVKSHVEKLSLFNDRITECNIYLRLEQKNKEESKICEVKLNIPGKEHFASKRANTFEEAVSLTVDALKPQLERWKGSKSKRNSGSIPA